MVRIVGFRSVMVLPLMVSLGLCSLEAAGNHWKVEESDQEDVVAVAYGGILTMETKRTGGQLFGRQMTNGQDLLQLIFRDGELVACEKVQGQTPELSLFLHQYSNLTSVVQRGVAKFKVTKPELSEPLVDWNRSWKECVSLQEAKKELVGRTRRRDPVKAEVESSRSMSMSRSRRGAWSLILPGTTWCGVGNSSDAGNVVDGVHVETDRCCRNHDMCPATIEGFTRKYNLFNFRFHTISHCECDDAFRRCLKMAGDENSNIVGRLFFDVISIKCFVLKWEDTCVERTWYGKCTLQGQQQSAETRDPIPYQSRGTQ